MFDIVHKDSAKRFAVFFLLAGQDGMEESKIRSTLFFFSSFTTRKSWRFVSQARMRQEHKLLLPRAVIINTSCVLHPTLFEQGKKHTSTPNF